MDRQLRPNTLAAMWMALTVFLWSWYPLAVALVGVDVGPFVYMFWHNLAVATAWIIFLVWAYPKIARRKEMWLVTIRSLRTRDGILSSLSAFEILTFVAAAQFIDPALVMVITSGWLILFVVLQKQYDIGSRYTRLSNQDWFLMSAAMAGVALVILSQSDSFEGDHSGWRLLAGVLLAIVTSVGLALISIKFKLGTRIYHQHIATDARDKYGSGAEVACMGMVNCVTNLPGSLFGLLIALILPLDRAVRVDNLNRVVSSDIIWVITIGLVIGAGSITFRYANTGTSNLGVNTIQYLRPVLALVWLYLFATVDVVRSDWLIVGAVVVITANVLVNFRSEDRAGFRWGWVGSHLQSKPGPPHVF